MSPWHYSLFEALIFLYSQRRTKWLAVSVYVVMKTIVKCVTSSESTRRLSISPVVASSCCFFFFIYAQHKTFPVSDFIRIRLCVVVQVATEVRFPTKALDALRKLKSGLGDERSFLLEYIRSLQTIIFGQKILVCCKENVTPH